MRFAQILLISALVTVPAGPAALAQSDADERPPLSESLEKVFRDLMDEMGPAIDELSETFEIFEQIDSLEHYQRPEVLPNGDIIIRRREDAPPLPATDAEPGLRT